MHVLAYYGHRPGSGVLVDCMEKHINGFIVDPKRGHVRAGLHT